MLKPCVSCISQPLKAGPETSIFCHDGEEPKHCFVLPVLVWAEKKNQTKGGSQKYQSAIMLSAPCHSLKKIPNQKTQNHYNICLKKHIKYPSSVKCKSPWKKFHLSRLYLSGRREEHCSCPDQWLNILENIWFNAPLNSLWGMCH